MINKGQWREFGQDTGVTPLLFYDECHGIFNDHRESGPRFNVSSERCIIFSVELAKFVDAKTKESLSLSLKTSEVDRCLWEESTVCILVYILIVLSFGIDLQVQTAGIILI